MDSIQCTYYLLPLPCLNILIISDIKAWNTPVDFIQLKTLILGPRYKFLSVSSVISCYYTKQSIINYAGTDFIRLYVGTVF